MNNTALYALTVIIWGSTWIAINYQLGTVAPEVSIVYRFAFAALILFAFCILTKRSIFLPLKHHLRLALFGLSLFGCNYYFLYQAQQNINSALSCIGFSTLLIFNIINARLWYKTPISKNIYLGSALGIIGIVTLFWPQVKTVSFTDVTLIGLGLCLIGTMFASAGNMLSIKNQKLALPIVQANAWGMTYGALVMTLIAFVQGKTFTFDWQLPYISSLLYLSVFGSVIAFGCYLSLMTRIGPHKTSYANILFPAVAVAISTIVEGFEWNSYTIIGFIGIMAGNLVILVKPKTHQKLPSIKAELV